MSNWNFFRLRMNINGQTVANTLEYPLRGFSTGPISGSNSQLNIVDFDSKFQYMTGSIFSAFSYSPAPPYDDNFYVCNYFSNNGTATQQIEQFKFSRVADASSATHHATFKITNEDLASALNLGYSSTFIKDMQVFGKFVYILHYFSNLKVWVSQLEITGSGTNLGNISTIDTGSSLNQSIEIGEALKVDGAIGINNFSIGGYYSGSAKFQRAIYGSARTSGSMLDKLQLFKLPITGSSTSGTVGLLAHTASIKARSSSLDLGDFGPNNTHKVHAIDTFYDEQGTLGVNVNYLYMKRPSSDYGISDTTIAVFKDPSTGTIASADTSIVTTTISSSDTSTNLGLYLGSSYGDVEDTSPYVYDLLDEAYRVVTFSKRNGNSGAQDVGLTASFFSHTPANFNFVPR